MTPPSARRVEAVTAAICESIITHLRCTYPQCGCKHAPIQARAAIAASDAALAEEGLVCVPVKPTEAMIEAGAGPILYGGPEIAPKVWEYMIAAAPGRSEPT